MTFSSFFLLFFLLFSSFEASRRAGKGACGVGEERKAAGSLRVLLQVPSFCLAGYLVTNPWGT